MTDGAKRGKTWIIFGLVGLLLIIGAALLISLSGGSGDEPEDEPDETTTRTPDRKPGKRFRGVIPHRPEPRAVTAGKPASTTHELINTIKDSRDPDRVRDKYDNGPHIKVTIAGQSTRTTPPDVVMQLSKKIPRVSGCYQRQLRKKPGLAGKITLRFNWKLQKKEAVVDKVEMASSDLKNFELESCILKAVSDLPGFPASIASGKSFDYSFSLQPGGSGSGAAVAPASGNKTVPGWEDPDPTAKNLPKDAPRKEHDPTKVGVDPDPNAKKLIQQAHPKEHDPSKVGIDPDPNAGEERPED